EWLDRLCFSGRVGWGRFSWPQNPKARTFAPLRTSPIALYQRENLQDWLVLAQANSAAELSAGRQVVFDALANGGALFFTELVRIYRRWEARGEIRGGYFVGGASGEQFALPEAIGLLRSIRKTPSKGTLVTLSAADPLNLQGILTSGPRIAAVTANRILFRD